MPPPLPLCQRARPARRAGRRCDDCGNYRWRQPHCDPRNLVCGACQNTRYGLLGDNALRDGTATPCDCGAQVPSVCAGMAPSRAHNRAGFPSARGPARGGVVLVHRRKASLLRPASPRQDGPVLRRLVASGPWREPGRPTPPHPVDQGSAGSRGDRHHAKKGSEDLAEEGQAPEYYANPSFSRAATRRPMALAAL